MNYEYAAIFGKADPTTQHVTDGYKIKNVSDLIGSPFLIFQIVKHVWESACKKHVHN